MNSKTFKEKLTKPKSTSTIAKHSKELAVYSMYNFTMTVLTAVGCIADFLQMSIQMSLVKG